MEKVNLNRILKDIETSYVKKALEHTGNNVTHAAELLGLNRTTLYMKLEVLGIAISRPKRIVSEKNGIANAFLIRSINNVEDELYNE